MFSSHLVRYEAEKTKDETQRNYLIIDFKGLEPIPEDEKPLGFHHMQTDIYGLRGARSLYERQT